MRCDGTGGWRVVAREIGLRPIVSQGCRPIGRHLVITKAKENAILELGGKLPLDQLREMWMTLSDEEKELFQRGWHVGRVVNEYQGEFQRGDFLIRNVVGWRSRRGVDHHRLGARGQTIQIQVRDAASADEDLRALLQMDMGAHEKRPAGGWCSVATVEEPDCFPAGPRCQGGAQRAGAVPLAGFFAMGELGPVGGKNFIHASRRVSGCLRKAIELAHSQGGNSASGRGLAEWFEAPESSVINLKYALRKQSQLLRLGKRRKVIKARIDLRLCAGR